MTKYYKQINENGEVIMLLVYDFAPNITNSLIVEITKTEYDELLAPMKAAVEAEEDEARRIAEIAELKAQAYDIITGVSE